MTTKKGRKSSGKRPRATSDNEMRPEYDFSAGIRGNYAGRFRQGTNIVVLDPDVAARFPSAEAVNRALRSIAKLADKTGSPRRSRRRTA